MLLKMSEESDFSPYRSSVRASFCAQAQVSKRWRIESTEEVCHEGKALSVSCTYSETGPLAVDLIRESFRFFLKKELAVLDIRPQM